MIVCLRLKPSLHHDGHEYIYICFIYLLLLWFCVISECKTNNFPHLSIAARTSAMQNSVNQVVSVSYLFLITLFLKMHFLFPCEIHTLGTSSLKMLKNQTVFLFW